MKVVHFHVIGPGIALLTINFVELSTAISFEHENNHILSKYLSHVFPLPQVPGSKGIDLSASMHSIMVGGKGKNMFWQNKRSIHKNIENKERTVIVK